MKKYESPVMDVKKYAQFERVFTYCTKGNDDPHNCYDVSGSGNAGDAPQPKNLYAAHDGGSNTVIGS